MKAWFLIGSLVLSWFLLGTALGQPVVVPIDPVVAVSEVPVVVEEKGILDYVIDAAYAALISMATIAAGYLVALFRKLAKGAGINLTDIQAEKVQGFVERSIKWAAEELKIRLTGKNTAEEKSQIITLAATQYIPKFARETIHDLGGDVDDVPAMTAIVTARGADVLNTPAPGTLEVARVDATKVAAGQQAVPGKTT